MKEKDDILVEDRVVEVWFKNFIAGDIYRAGEIKLKKGSNLYLLEKEINEGVKNDFVNEIYKMRRLNQDTFQFLILKCEIVNRLN